MTRADREAVRAQAEAEAARELEAARWITERALVDVAAVTGVAPSKIRRSTAPRARRARRAWLYLSRYAARVAGSMLAEVVGVCESTVARAVDADALEVVEAVLRGEATEVLREVMA